MDNKIEVIVKGYTIYCKSYNDELYDMFIPNTDYRMSNEKASTYINDSDELIAVKRDTQKFTVEYQDLKAINLKK